MNAQATFKHDAPPVLELENVSIAYDGKPVVHNVSFSIHAGEVLALANAPSYNPNNREKIDPARKRNRALTDVYEPGSTMKTVTVAAGLEAGKIKPVIYKTFPLEKANEAHALMEASTHVGKIMLQVA